MKLVSITFTNNPYNITTFIQNNDIPIVYLSLITALLLFSSFAHMLRSYYSLYILQRQKRTIEYSHIKE